MRGRDILLLLVLGALTSIAVAWAGLHADFNGVEPTMGTREGRRAAVWTSPLLTTVWSGDDFRSRASSCEVPRWSRGIDETGSAKDVGAGWPLRCMRATMWGSQYVWCADVDGLMAGCDVPFVDDLLVGSSWLPAVLLPTAPVWPGLIADTVFYACAWSIPMLALYGFRCLVRRRRGTAMRCTQCGHSRLTLADDAICLECAAAPGGRTPLVTRTARGFGIAAAAALVLTEASVVAVVLASPAVTPLHLAAHRGDLASVDALLAAGADPNAPVSAHAALGGGWSPLAIAVLAGHVDICDRLWAAEAVATGPRSLLVCAVQSGRPAMVQSLLDRGFGPSDRRERDDLLLTAAETSVEMTAFIHDRARWSVHNRAAALGRAIEVGNEPVVEFLLGAGVSPTCEYKTQMGCLVSRHTPLSIAVERYGCFPRLLPRLLADADVIPHSVLEAAVRSGSTDALDRLIEAGADPRSVGNRSRTLWWVAADRPDLWPYLLEIGVDPNRPDASGQRPGTRNEGLRRFLREHAAVPAVSGD